MEHSTDHPINQIIQLLMDTTLKLALQLIEVMKYRIEFNELPSGIDTLYREVMKEYDRAKIDGRDTEVLNTIADRILWLKEIEEIK